MPRQFADASPQQDRIPFDFRPYIPSVALTAGVSNVVMQLSYPAVGYGVIESKVTSGQAMRHPLKRSRTTFTYIAVALLGTDEERNAYRAAVNESHRQVRSDADSPVAYNAFNRGLQLWVAACLYVGLRDMAEWLQPHLPESEKDALYQASSIMGTMLQVQRSDWPADRAAFELYWNETVREFVKIDEPVRVYLLGLMQLRNFPFPVPQIFGRLQQFLSTGWLPPKFREAMKLEWTERDQHRFDRFKAAQRVLHSVVPRPFQNAIWVLNLWDFRFRKALRMRLV